MTVGYANTKVNSWRKWESASMERRRGFGSFERDDLQRNRQGGLLVE